MRKAASIVLGSVEYGLTLFLASCLFTIVFRWAYRPDGFGFGTMLMVIVGGLVLNLILLAIYYWFRIFARQTFRLRLVGAIGLAIVSTAITIPATSLIEEMFELPSQHVPGSW